MESLFNQYEAMTSLGSEISEEFEEAFLPVFHKYFDAGHSGRELQLIADSVLTGLVAVAVLRRATDRRRVEQRIANQVWSACPPCGGYGAMLNATCEVCGGKGRILSTHPFLSEKVYCTL